MKDLVVVNISMPIGFKSDLDHWAALEKMKRSEFIRQAIRVYISRLKKGEPNGDN